MKRTMIKICLVSTALLIGLQAICDIPEIRTEKVCIDGFYHTEIIKVVDDELIVNLEPHPYRDWMGNKQPCR